MGCPVRRSGSAGASRRSVALPLVLLHGTPFSSYVWRAVARSLGRDH
ncbi:alpha/beta hydrolase, partial [Streptomyces sp. LRa12]